MNMTNIFKQYMNMSIKIFKLLTIGSVLVLAGCASNAATDQMVSSYVVTQPPKNKKLIQNITVSQVTGGRETNPLWMSKINNDNFKAALVQSLQEANLYHQLDGANYSLAATLIRLHQPFIGINYTVVCEVNYLLKNIANDETVYNKNITTSYTAKFSDSPIAVIRLKKANEGAARANIKQLIDDLYQLPKVN
jgi:hypothetical protein